MVNSVTSVPYYSYLNQLDGIGDSAATSSSGASTTASAAATTPSANTAAEQEVSSLLNNGGFAPEVLTLLQGTGANAFNPITSLLGGTGTNDALTSVYANLFASSTAASLTEAENNNTPSQAGTTTGSTGTATPATTSAQSLIAGLNQASVAYNNTLVQNAASVAQANDYGPDGVTPLVA